MDHENKEKGNSAKLENVKSAGNIKDLIRQQKREFTEVK